MGGGDAAGGRAASAPIRAYRGLGTWFDMWDYSPSTWKNPEAAAAKLAVKMKARGVVTLYLETANYHMPEGAETIYRRDAVGPIIEQCHAQGIKVVAWYLPGFTNLAKDWARSKAAIDFRSATGQKFDSFTLDIEATTVKPATLRTKRLMTLSNKIRAKVGSSYPLGACIMSPAGMTKSPSIWPGFPYAGLAAIYDVFVPMGYYTYHGDGYANAYRDTRDNIRIIREQTGLPSIPIHVIGGDAAKSSVDETMAYVRALRENGALGRQPVRLGRPRAKSPGRSWPTSASTLARTRPCPSCCRPRRGWDTAAPTARTPRRSSTRPPSRRATGCCASASSTCRSTRCASS